MQQVTVPPPFEGTPIAAIQVPGDPGPRELLFAKGNRIWWLGPEGAADSHLEAVGETEAFRVLVRMKRLGGPWFWVDRGALPLFLPHFFSKRGKTASIPALPHPTLARSRGSL